MSRGTQDASSGSWRFAALPSWLTSSVVHVILLLALALFTFPLPLKYRPTQVVVLNETKEIASDLSEFQAEAPAELTAESPQQEVPAPPDVMPSDFLETPTEFSAAPPPAVVDPLGLDGMLTSDLTGAGGALEGTALGGRSAAAKKQLLREAGGTPGSEAAVALGLKWLALHQNPDGSWSLDHRRAPQCRAQCGNPGERQLPVPFGATALALLPFLGAGHTHQEGDYRQAVDRGLGYLLRGARVSGNRGSLADPGGNYYSHGLCTIVLCEAYAMTSDPRLKAPAQLLINEIVHAQDPIGGGWRYRSRQPGDTSVLGWQFMALKSAHLAGLQVPPVTVQRASAFLDSVADEQGFKFRYQAIPSSMGTGGSAPTREYQYRKSTSAVGLLCRMYLGWPRDDSRLADGIEYLNRTGPSLATKRPDVYFDYYATQVMRHFGGAPWERWNDRLRDKVIALQATEGHETGSWYTQGRYDAAGGRLYCTSLATMILEVYYRHLPIFKSHAVEDDFPLE